jgi:hypothetical protein
MKKIMKTPISIKFKKSPNHIGEYLTHWTGRNKPDDEALNIICQIIKSKKLKLSPCPNGYSNSDGIKIEVPMICFTETPIEHSIEHCSNFGSFGIGFDKKEMMKIGANPVLYITNDRKNYQNKFRDYYWNELKEQWGSQTDIPFDISNNLSWFLATTQPYTDKLKGKIREYYSQREWRIVRMLPTGITAAAIKRWGAINDGFDISKIKCEFEERNVGGVQKQVQIGYLSFKKSAIKSIIVPKKYGPQAEKIRRDEGLTGCDIILTS